MGYWKEGEVFPKEDWEQSHIIRPWRERFQRDGFGEDDKREARNQKQKHQKGLPLFFSSPSIPSFSSKTQLQKRKTKLKLNPLSSPLILQWGVFVGRKEAHQTPQWAPQSKVWKRGKGDIYLNSSKGKTEKNLAKPVEAKGFSLLPSNLMISAIMVSTGEANHTDRKDSYHS